MKTLNPRTPEHEYFIKMAILVSERGTCLRRRTGAVFAKQGRPLVSGYNGTAEGMPHCNFYHTEKGCYIGKDDTVSGSLAGHEICRAIHAEQNAILQAARAGISIYGAILYCTNEPCTHCTKLISNLGIKEIFYLEEYNDPHARDLRKEYGMTCLQVTIGSGVEEPESIEQMVERYR